jgi:hypothetical protein
MKDTIRNIVFLSIIFFSISYDCFTSGVAYDKKYKLSPEIPESSCVFYFKGTYEYGNRWKRIGFTFFAFGISSLLAIFLVYKRRSEPILEKRLSLLSGEANENWRYST